MSTATKEAKRITIEGDLVRLERTVIERTAMASDFLAEIARTQPMETGLLPEGCVLFSRHCDIEKRTCAIYVIERPPGMQLIRYNCARAGHEIQELNLSWPRTIWFFRTSQAPSSEFASIQDLWVAATRASIHVAARDTALYCLPMPNLYEFGNGAVCMGNLSLEESKTPASLRVTGLLRQVLESAWNIDLMPSFEGLGIGSLEEWAKASATDPAFHEKIRLHKHVHASVDAMLKHLATHAG